MPIVSVDHLTLFELTPPELVDAAAGAGFTPIGLRLHPAAPPQERQHPMVGDSPMRRETLGRMRSTGVTVFDCGVFRLKRGVDIAAFEPVLESAAVLGAGHALVNGDERNPAVLADLLARLCELGEYYRMRMHLEFTPWTGIPTLSSAVRVVGACGHANARGMIDTIHVDRSGGTPAELRQVPRERLDYMQLCDASGPRPTDFATMIDQARNERAFPGEGNLDLVGMLDALPADSPLRLDAPVQSLAGTLTPVGRARRGWAAIDALIAALERTRTGSRH